jgi:hypothetical protein
MNMAKILGILNGVEQYRQLRLLRFTVSSSSLVVVLAPCIYIPLEHEWRMAGFYSAVSHLAEYRQYRSDNFLHFMEPAQSCVESIRKTLFLIRTCVRTFTLNRYGRLIATNLFLRGSSYATFAPHREGAPASHRCKQKHSCHNHKRECSASVEHQVA